jgi:hypothetical protein
VEEAQGVDLMAWDRVPAGRMEEVGVAAELEAGEWMDGWMDGFSGEQKQRKRERDAWTASVFINHIEAYAL